MGATHDVEGAPDEALVAARTSSPAAEPAASRRASEALHKRSHLCHPVAGNDIAA